MKKIKVTNTIFNQTKIEIVQYPYVCLDKVNTICVKCNTKCVVLNQRFNTLSIYVQILCD